MAVAQLPIKNLLRNEMVTYIICYVNSKLVFYWLFNSLLRRPSKTAQPLVCADRPKPPSKLTVRGPFVYRDHILLLH